MTHCIRLTVGCVVFHAATCQRVTRTERGMKMHCRIVHNLIAQPELPFDAKTDESIPTIGRTETIYTNFGELPNIGTGDDDTDDPEDLNVRDAAERT